ncbi:MAG: S-layer protein [Methanomicrobiales archaeon]|jgi:hypothetical protein|nr:S-layer protein [Methanomicrobiales archaeon]
MTHKLYTIIAGIAIIALLSTPVFAGTKYYSGGPALSASVQGMNELSPGETISLTVAIENQGVIDYKMVQEGSITPDDMPNTAKHVVATLKSGDSGIVVKSGSVTVGDIPGSQTKPVTFTITVPVDASQGTITLPLHIAYSNMISATQEGLEVINYNYKSSEVEIPLTLVIKPSVVVKVDDISVVGLNAGTEGYLTLTLTNIGTIGGKDATIGIKQNGNSPVVPTDSSIYVGELSVGEKVEAKFKISARKGAEEQSYPLDLFVAYENLEGIVDTSNVVTIGVPVSGKITFAIVNDANQLRSGQKAVIEVAYENTGNAPAYEAQARISAVDPFTTNDDNAYLGDLLPGESAVGKFELKVANDVTEKTYTLDSEVRYKDALNNDVVSDTVKVKIDVGKGAKAPISPLVALAALGVIGAVCAFGKRRNDRE